MELSKKKEKDLADANIKNNLAKFKKLVLLAKNIDYDAEGTIDSLQTTCPECDNIDVLKQGVKGAYTRDKTIAMAKTQLFNYLGNTLESITKDLEVSNLANYLQGITAEVDSYVSTITKDVNVNELKKRKESYTRNSVTMEYFSKKLNQCLTEKLITYKACTKQTDLLYAFREILSMVVVNDLSHVEPFIKQTNDNLNKLKYMFDTIGTVDYHHVDVHPTQTEVVVSSNEIVNVFLGKVKYENTGTINPIDVLSGIIERTEQILNNLKQTKDEILSKLTSLPDVDKEIKNVLTSLLSDTILAYLKFSTITVEEFNRKLKDGYEILDSLFVMAMDEKIIVANAVLNYFNGLSAFGEIYNVIDEITAKGTFEEK